MQAFKAATAVCALTTIVAALPARDIEERHLPTCHFTDPPTNRISTYCTRNDFGTCTLGAYIPMHGGNESYYLTLYDSSCNAIGGNYGEIANGAKGTPMHSELPHPVIETWVGGDPNNDWRGTSVQFCYSGECTQSNYKQQQACFAPNACWTGQCYNIPFDCGSFKGYDQPASHPKYDYPAPKTP